MRPCVERYRRGAGAGSRQNGNQSFVAAKLARLPTSGAYIRRGGYAQVTSPEVGARLVQERVKEDQRYAEANK